MACLLAGDRDPREEMHVCIADYELAVSLRREFLRGRS